MSSSHIKLTEDLAAYLREVSLREPDLLRKLREETASLSNAGMQITPEQGQFMRLLVQLMNVRNALEIGTFTGYSSTCVALGLPADGKLICCDVSEEYTRIARSYWREAGVESRIDLRLGPALQTLDQLEQEGRAGSFDFAFIDADKKNYSNYLERVYVLLRTGGVAAIDNVLWHGRVIDPGFQDEDTVAVRTLNKALSADKRFSISMLPIGDGLTLAVKV